MRLKLDLSLPTLSALFQPEGGYFPGPVIAPTPKGERRDVVVGFNWRHDDGQHETYLMVPMLFFGGGLAADAADCFLDLSIPWVHERVASTCLSLLGVKGARAASMTRSQAGTVYTLRWVDGDDGLPDSAPHRMIGGKPCVRWTGLPQTASWDRLGGAPVIGLYQNDLVSAYRLKLSSIPRLELQPGATGDEALGALLLALDGREAKRAVPTPATP